MQLVILLSHLSYTTGEPALLFIIANKIATSVVALYFFTSGYGLMQSALSGGGVGSLSSRLWRLFKPLLYIGLLYFGICYILGRPISSYWLSDLYHHGATPIPNIWFAIVLHALYTAFWLSFRYIEPRRWIGIVALLILSIGCIAWCYLMNYERAWWVTTLGFWGGVLYARYEHSIYSLLRHWWGMLVGLIFVGLIVYSRVELALTLTYIVIPMVIIALLNRIGYTHWIKYSSPTSTLRRVLNYLSSISYELYLIHGIIIALLHSIGPPYIYSIAVLIVSVVSADLLHRLILLRIWKR